MDEPLGFDVSNANCRGADIHLFYPNLQTLRGVGAIAIQKQAIHICGGCQVKEPCLEYAVKNEAEGIWGGTTEVEREAIRIKRKISLPLDRPRPDTVKRALRTGSIRKLLKEGY